MINLDKRERVDTAAQINPTDPQHSKEPTRKGRSTGVTGCRLSAEVIKARPPGRAIGLKSDKAVDGYKRASSEWVATEK